MIIGDLDTRVAAAQLNLIFDIEAIFKRRGQKIAVFEKNEDLLFDPTNYGAFEKYYPVFHSSTFRRISSIVGSFTDGLTLDDICSRSSDLEKSKTIDILNYDVMLVRENQIGYIECKSANFSNLNILSNNGMNFNGDAGNEKIP